MPYEFLSSFPNERRIYDKFLDNSCLRRVYDFRYDYISCTYSVVMDDCIIKGGKNAYVVT